ncbi:hypothetical protein CFB50_00820 [Burkholderia sp. AU33423]|uniref:hypothetical protein n=1 Tax=Burkholderia lata (strain ATCC 17760 / DSM 23089 / LMG 22485 / NCIMB 9086 / R18194 / 383) TaxID=482957 RepID=UPI0009F4A837|nr:hypothetical protein [Burkholderia lata]OXI91777.1 hypothetical protein CFB50_00820 [Burkholderia sp. AU33423]
MRRALSGPSSCGGARREPAGSARESWLSRLPARKSLIPEETAALRRAGFATCHAAFAMSPAGAPAAAPSSFSLFNSLKKKKKETREAAATRRHRAPRVGAALPSVAGDAAISRHGFRAAATPE